MTTPEKIVSAVAGITLRSGDPQVRINSVAYDSREVKKGGLFIALRGEHFDGHDFIDAAVDAGAAAIVVERDHCCDFSIPILEADNTRRILGPVASHFYSHPSTELCVVGITGTNGKTSSTYLLESIMEATEKSPGVVGTIEYRWCGRRQKAANTTPDGLILQQILRAMVDDGVDVAITEVSSHGLENGRVEGTAFDVALFTNLTRDHVDFHGSMDAYRRAKWRLFEEYLSFDDSYIEQGPIAVINTQREEGKRLAAALVQQRRSAVVSFAIDDEPVDGVERHFQGQYLEMSLEGIRMAIDESPGPNYEVFAPVSGKYNAENVLGAVATARMVGTDIDAVVRGLAETGGIPGRMERVEGPQDSPTVFVDYAHSPDALEQVLRTLSDLTQGHLWVLFGCGGDRDKSKRAIMGQVAVAGADQVLITSDNPRSEDPNEIIDQVVSGVEKYSQNSSVRATDWRRQPDRRTAIFDAVLQAGPQDVILIAGKGHETTQESNGRRRRFDDRLVAGEALRRRGEL